MVLTAELTAMLIVVFPEAVLTVVLTVMLSEVVLVALEKAMPRVHKGEYQTCH